jgi:hypothetical protein
VYSLIKTILKLSNSFFILIFLSKSVFSDELRVIKKLKYYSTHVDDLGYNYNSSRPGLNGQIHFIYSLNEKIKIKSLNYISEAEDEFQDGITYNFKFNQKFAIDFKLDSFVLSPYGKMINYDKNPSKQSDNSHIGLSITKNFINNSKLTLDYRDELSKGSKIGSNKVYQNVFGVYYYNKNFFSDKLKLKLGYTEVQNVRSTKLVKFSKDINKNIEIGIKFMDNDGKGAYGSNNIDENRKFIISEISYSF